MKRIPPFAALASAMLLSTTAAFAQTSTTETTPTDPALETAPTVTPDAGSSHDMTTEPEGGTSGVDATGAPADPLIEGQPEATPVAPDPAATDVPASPESDTGMDSGMTTAPADIVAADTFIVPEGYSAVTDWTALTADQLLGATLYASDGTNMGSVSDLVLSTEGPVSAVVADVGGFLGIGQHTISLNHDQVTLYRDEGGTVIAATTLDEEALKALPAWEKPE